MKRLPLRLRLAALFTLAMGLVLAAAGYVTLTRFAEAQGEYVPVLDPARRAASREALADLRRELLTALPIVFVIAGVGAYLLAAAALRPVERMRAQAAAVTEDTPGLRLDVPRSRDEIARLADTLNTMLDRLAAALQRERRFVADAGHELRTPLSLLRTEIELALRHPRGPDELRAALASALEESVRLIHLTEDLLLLARTDRHATGTPPTAEPQSAAVAPILNRLAVRLGQGAPERVITVDCPPTLRVALSEDRFERSITNLLHNALHHGKGPIEITARADDGQVRVQVTDHGPGFPPDFLPRAFDRFTRADTARTGTGTGLGLAITAAIARSAGGHYGAANRPGGGADAWIALPAATPA